MAKVKEYSKRFLCILSVCVSLLMAVFYPFEEFEAAVVKIISDYTFPEQEFPSINASLWDASEGVVSVSDYSLISDAYFFVDDNGNAYVPSSNYKYRFSGYFYVTESSTVNVSFSTSSSVSKNVDYSVQYYFLFNGQEFPCYTTDGKLYWFVFDSFGGGFSYFDLKCEVDALIDFDFLVDEYDMPDHCSYRFSSNVYNFHLSLSQLTGDDMLSPTDRIFNNSLEDINSTLEDVLECLENAFGATGENEEFEDMSSTEMGDLGTKEDDLLGTTSPDDAASNIEVTIDEDSSSVIWDIINDFVTSNDVVFGGFISLLSLGVISLILNR